jgi:predicted metal-binding membrane protein
MSVSDRVRLTGTRASGAVVITLGIAAACWFFAIRQMNGMNMGVATGLGSFGFFIGVWALMMAAMMLPGAAPAVFRQARASARAYAAPLFVGSYLAVWTLVGVLIYAIYRPHGTSLAGAVVIAAGLYELTPLKRSFRQSCRERLDSGLGFGICCVGSSAGLMAVMVVLGVMSVTWMSVIAVVVVAQKLLPERRAVDVLLAVAIIALGVLVFVTPGTVPGLTPPMSTPSMSAPAMSM